LSTSGQVDNNSYSGGIKMILISKSKAHYIIENYHRTNELKDIKGSFYIKEKDSYVAIDNTTGEAWTEEFKTLDEVRIFLNGGYVYE